MYKDVLGCICMGVNECAQVYMGLHEYGCGIHECMSVWMIMSVCTWMYMALNDLLSVHMTVFEYLYILVRIHECTWV